MKETWTWLKRFFLNYFWLGVVLILLAIILDLKLADKTLIENTAISLIETLGISIMIASIFTFAASTSEFTNKLTSLLRDIVIDRNFLGNIDGESKKDALRALIKPSKAELQSYSDIGRYYDMYIKHTMNITNKSVRSDYSVTAKIFKEEEKVKSKSLISYRLHPTIDGYTDMNIMLDKSETGSSINWIRITAPSGKRIFDEVPDTEKIDYIGKKADTLKIPLKELGKGYNHLKVEFEVTEIGLDHWIHLTFYAMEPTDGFRYNIECRDGLIVKDYVTFIYGSKFYVDKLNDNKQILFSCDEWINEGTGLAAVISDEQT